MESNATIELFISIRDTIESIQPVIWNIRRQNYFGAMTAHSEVLRNLTNTAEYLLTNSNNIRTDQEIFNTEQLLNILSELNHAQQSHDYILLADIYELKLIPVMCRIQECLIQNSGGFLCDEKRYDYTMAKLNATGSLRNIYDILVKTDPVEHIYDMGLIIEPISTGHITMAVNTVDGRSYYLHSNSDIYHEAFLLASYWYEEQVEEYIVYGLGLGYHIKALADFCAYAKIRVYESNSGVLCSAAAFGILSELIEYENIEVIYDPEFIELNTLLNHLSENTVLIVHNPSLYTINNKKERDALESYSIQYHSYKGQKKYLNGNFKKNILLYDEPVDALYNNIKGKDVYLIAAGPSLDKNVSLLRLINDDLNIKRKSVVIAMGTVFGKLLKLGIIPDYIIASDAKPNTYFQIKGLEDKEIPLIGLSTLYYKFYEKYKGKKYIVFQDGYAPAMEAANKLGSRLYETGGSVITTAFDVVLKLDSRRVILLGADFAYTGGELHASGTHRSPKMTDENMIYVKDIYGNEVATGKNLNIYRKWIEQEIVRYGHRKVIDATEGGAYIKGTEVKTLRNVINECKDV